MHHGVARHDIQIPGKAVAGVVLPIGNPAHDLAIVVFGPLIGAVGHRNHQVTPGICGVSGAFGIVGQAAIGLHRDRIDRHPFGPVHRGGPHGRCGSPGVDADHRGIHSGGVRGQGDPLAGGIGVEFGHIQLAIIQQARRIAALNIAARRDPFIQELTAFIIAHIHHHAPVARNRQGRVFMFEPAQSRVFDRDRCGIGRVNFDDIAKAVRLVRGLGDVKPGVEFLIGVASFGGNAVAVEPSGQGGVGGGRAEIAVKVFLAGQIGAPRGAPRAAIVQRAQYGSAGRVGGGLQQRMPGSGARQNHGRVIGDPAVELRIEDRRPAIRPLGQFKDADPLNILQFQHVIGAGGHPVIGIAGQVHLGVGIFVVDHDDLTATDFKQLHPISVFTECPQAGGGGAAGCAVKFRRIRKQRLAPFDQRLPAVTGGHLHGGIGGDVNRGKGKPRCRLRLSRG